ncbi:MAG: recombinase family protein [Paraclostridium sp.]
MKGLFFMIYGYVRVSTKNQLEGFGLETQKNEILEKYPSAKIFEEQFTGSKLDRPILKDILNSLKSNDTLIVTKLDRLARNTVDGIQIIEGLFNKGVAIHVLNVGLLENTTMGKFFLTTLLAVAEMERNIIIERTQSGKELAKQDINFKEGRPKIYKSKQIDHALSLLENHTYRQVTDLTGISKSTLIRAKNKLSDSKNS